MTKVEISETVKELRFSKDVSQWVRLGVDVTCDVAAALVPVPVGLVDRWLGGIQKS